MPLEEEALKGRLLDAWIEDLRNDRPPRALPGMEELTPDVREEVLRLARWSKATFHPSQVPDSEVSALAKSLREGVYGKRQEEIRWTDQLIAQGKGFGASLRAARLHLDIDARALEERCTLSEGHIAHLESDQLPPHRIAVDKMLLLLRHLRFSGNIVDVIRRSCLEWAAVAYGREQTQLARIDHTVSDSKRVELLQNTSRDTKDALEREKRRIQQYCQDLASQW